MRQSVCLAAVWTALSLPALASDLTVRVGDVASRTGEIGCALFRDADGFPMSPPPAGVQWQAASSAAVTCRFTGVKPGMYAVAVLHDLNGNHRTDTNWLGIPTEPWGVSNNVRPTMRAPRFGEAAFSVAPDAEVTVFVRLVQP